MTSSLDLEKDPGDTFFTPVTLCNNRTLLNSSPNQRAGVNYKLRPFCQVFLLLLKESYGFLKFSLDER